MNEKLFGERLEKLKADLAESIEKVNKDEAYASVEAIMIGGKLERIAARCDNYNISQACNKVWLKLAPTWTSTDFFGRPKSISKENYIKLLNYLIQIIEQEIPKEKEIDSIAEAIDNEEFNNSKLGFAIKRHAREIAILIRSERQQGVLTNNSDSNTEEPTKKDEGNR